MDYVVSRGAGGWLVTAGGIDCGVVSDRATALGKALGWARETGEIHGRHVRVLVEDADGPDYEWAPQSGLPALCIAASAMQLPSAYFVRKLAEFRPLYISA
ncbi:MAG: hypothetical protein ACWA6X_00375 [Bauldia sp.]